MRLTNLFQVIIAFLIAIISFTKVYSQQYYLYVGTYTSGASEGIYVYTFDANTGKIQLADSVKIENPSYLTISMNGKNLYAVTENGGAKPGLISAFSISPGSGKLVFLNQKESRGDYPCYVAVSRDQKWVVAGNYGGGNLAAYATNPDGSLSDQVQVINHSGNSLNKSRQEGPHVHSTNFTPDNNYLLVPDLGTDKVMTYRFNSVERQNPLNTAVKPFTAITAGSGPRHLAFHPNAKWVYLVEELSGKVSTWYYKDGVMKLVQESDAHEPNYKGERGSADIHVSPDGRYVYTSNRGDANNLAIFKIDQQSGKLSIAGFQDVLGKTPRNFIMEPGGKFILVANQTTNDIRVFLRNPGTGLLTATDAVIKVSHPVCLQLLPIHN